VASLAVREALLDRQREQWLVVLTDRSDSDLGAGVLSHLVGHHRPVSDLNRLTFLLDGNDGEHLFTTTNPQ